MSNLPFVSKLLGTNCPFSTACTRRTDTPIYGMLFSWRIDCDTVHRQPCFVFFTLFWPVVILTFQSRLFSIWVQRLIRRSMTYCWTVKGLLWVFMTQLLHSLCHIWVEGSRLFLFWVVNRSRPPCCTAFLRAQCSTQSSSSSACSLYLISLNVTLS